MNKIEEIIKNSIKDKKITDEQMMTLLKRAFIAGYEQCLEDRKKIQGIYEIK